MIRRRWLVGGTATLNFKISGSDRMSTNSKTKLLHFERARRCAGAWRRSSGRILFDLSLPRHWTSPATGTGKSPTTGAAVPARWMMPGRTYTEVYVMPFLEDRGCGLSCKYGSAESLFRCEADEVREFVGRARDFRWRADGRTKRVMISFARRHAKGG